MTAGAPDIWGALPVPALLLDTQDRALRINPAAEGFLNASARAATGQRLSELLHLDAPLDAALARARAVGAPLFVADIAVGAGGRAPVQCSLQIAPIDIDAAGPDAAMLMLIIPSELAGYPAQDPSARPGARSAIGMAEMLAHEIKNPLAGIIGAAQLLSMTLGEEDRELTDLIVGESRRIDALLGQVESFGNLAPPRCRRVNVHDVLVRARRSALLGFAADMRIIEEYDPSLPYAWADPDMLLQVLQNLLKNAAEAAAPEGGTIILRSCFEQGVRLRGDGGTGAPLPLQIEVIDDGPGVPPELTSSLFEPFVSGRENGTGLGLALAARIMAGQGGWIAVNSRPGRTVFRLSLPLATSKLEAG
ncbi:two-component system sensor histidine kinase NtrB [Roseovarius sp. Pro17]|uniref:two-component system sensor histidine kinase NtrB n=1 Tax=Roseovarius sp. Pro17 TaxID=3108175 RepID=UPI002D777AF8|nr:ATP-binding protein [Roseovarius sp. Pro17]